MQKFLISSLFFVLFFSFNKAYSETGEEVCNDISFSSDRQECLDFIRGRYVDIDAGYVCIRARFNGGKLNCIKVSADKEYTLNEANFCDEFNFDDERIACMRNSGRDSEGGGGRVIQRINVLSNQALRSIDRGEINEAYEKILLIRQLSNN
jgi:hypothetical protein